MDTSLTPHNPGPALARIEPTRTGYVIDCRGPHGARHYDLASVAEAAEFARILRDQGGWALRFGPRAGEVRDLVEELDLAGV
ncbi:hypothetical protein [Lichenibacterium ramalinae]|uniref:Uncharacterized protein n=1 Tax=Lichenibacterium ramalinae TaxID=2316527 RepID=A0A4Q2RHM4_9HYPH|nr:hypothetical protein [Lichenibacterium ramalinae]RYB06234.1 hypothetical protein D3272_05565 [Lichenibacterium ramalinae]